MRFVDLLKGRKSAHTCMYCFEGTRLVRLDCGTDQPGSINLGNIQVGLDSNNSPAPHFGHYALLNYSLILGMGHGGK